VSAVVTRPALELTNFHGMVTVAPQMLEVFALIERVARTHASVLLRGESGTGKELAARALHVLSPRAAGPFRAVNCATLTPELAASELFGHVRGAFTGAIGSRAGLFELADGGTVFLDEVAELGLDVQARLLRVLQDKTFVPVGGTDPKQVDLRLITATHRSLRREVEAGRFREDLMYRVRVVPIFIPPLNERTGDVEALTWLFIDRFNEQGFRRVERVSVQAYELLQSYPWPGNIRELRNAIEHAFAVGLGPVLEASELPPELRGELPPDRGEHLSPEDAEKARILEAIALADGSKSRAAELLGVSRTTLWRRMRELRLG
jgi:two-component system, NtrC family, response regulator AtoC